MAGRDGVEHDQEDDWATPAAAMAGARSRLLDPVARPRARPPDKSSITIASGQADLDDTAGTAGHATRDAERAEHGQPQGHDQPGQRVDPRKGDQGDWQQDELCTGIASRASDRCRGQAKPQRPIRTNPRARKTPRFVTGISQTKWRLIP